MLRCLGQERWGGIPMPFVEEPREPYIPAPAQYEPGMSNWCEAVRHLAHGRGLGVEEIGRRYSSAPIA